MVIVIEGTPLTKPPLSTAELYAKYPSVVEKGRNFAQQSVVEVAPEFSLYVAQGEFGVVPSHDPKIKIVGSDDATTCHIVILRHPSGTVGVAHFDGSKSEEALMSAMIKKISLIDGGAECLQLCVAGGYEPEEGSREALKNDSELLSRKILQMFSNHKCTFQLSLWCTVSLNTKLGGNGPQPIVYGVGVDILTGSIFPAYFSSHEPNLPLRVASRWVSGNDDRLYDIYDHKSGTIVIYPFHYTGMEYFSFYLKMPDEVLLKTFSTSPKVEPPQFCDDLRKVFRVFAEHPNPHVTLFPDNKAKYYYMTESGKWEFKHTG